MILRRSRQRVKQPREASLPPGSLWDRFCYRPGVIRAYLAPPMPDGAVARRMALLPEDRSAGGETSWQHQESETLSRTLFLIDGRYQIYRGYFGMAHLTDSRGRPVGAVYAIADLLLRLCRDHPVDLWAIAMECDGPTFRHDLYDQYKANREAMPEALSTQLPIIDRMLEAFRIPILQSPHHEADDCIATMATEAASQQIDVRLLTKDKDLEQVLSERVKFLDVSTGEVYGPEELHAKKGIRPQQVISYQSLVGDSSDNIPGVKGIGAKGAEKILSLVEDPATLLEDPVPDGIPPAALKKIRAQPDQLQLAKDLVTLSLVTPLDQAPGDLARIAPDRTQLTELFQELGFNRILDMMNKPVEEQASLFSAAEAATPSEDAACCSRGSGSRIAPGCRAGTCRLSPRHRHPGTGSGHRTMSFRGEFCLRHGDELPRPDRCHRCWL